MERELFDYCCIDVDVIKRTNVQARSRMDSGAWRGMLETASAVRLSGTPLEKLRLEEIPYFGEDATIFILASIGRFL